MYIPQESFKSGKYIFKKLFAKPMYAISLKNNFKIFNIKFVNFY